jgi:hypothetical protein
VLGAMTTAPGSVALRPRSHQRNHASRLARHQQPYHPGEPSRRHGAFTKVLLGALGRDADTNNDGLISMSELTAYLSAKVPELTGGHQHVGLSQGFQRELFVAGL